MTMMRFLPRFRAANRALDAMAAREQLSRAELEAYQLERLNALWRHAIERVPYYRTLAAEQALPRSFASLDEFRRRVPVLPKSVVMSNRESLLSETPVRGRWDRTSGSSGTPLSTYWGKDAYLETLRSRYRHGMMWGVDIFARTAMMWGRGSSVVSGFSGKVRRLRQSIEDRLRNRIRLSAYELGGRELTDQLVQLAHFQPAMIYGFSNAVHLLAMQAAASAFECDSLKVIILTGEPITPQIVDRVERAFGVPALAEYGSNECGIIANEWPDRTLRVCEHTTLVETLPRPDGRYDVVVTVLNNPAFPLLRYELGDITDAPLEHPERGFAILKNVVGRSNDLILTRDGHYLHPARIDALFEYEFEGVRRYRVRQGITGGLTVSLELSAGPPAWLAGLHKKLVELVHGYPVEIRVVDHIPLTAAGKHRPITSDLTGGDPSEVNLGSGEKSESVAARSAARRKSSIHFEKAS